MRKGRSPCRNDLVQKLILQQGFILESQVFQTLSAHYGLRLERPSADGFAVPTQEGTSQEVDVLAVISNAHQTLQNPQFTNHDFYQPESLADVKNVFVIECKGHSTNGILLCKLRHRTAPEQSRFTNRAAIRVRTGRATDFTPDKGRIHLNSPQLWIDGVSLMEVSPVVDACAFYNLSNNNGFTEDKSKLFKAIQQVSSRASSFDEWVKMSWRTSKSSLTAYTITPVICTNVPISVMRIDAETVSISEVEWAFIQNSEAIAADCSPSAFSHRLIPLVQSSAITKFCDAVMSNDPTALSIGIAEEQSVLTFNIKDAQQTFRDENKVS